MCTKYNLLWLLWLRSAHWYGLESALSSWQPVWGKSKCLPQSAIRGLVLALCLQKERPLKALHGIVLQSVWHWNFVNQKLSNKEVCINIPASPKLQRIAVPRRLYTFSPVSQAYGFICFWSYSPGVKLLPCASVYKHGFLSHLSSGH